MPASIGTYLWTDHPANPLIEPPRPEWLLGDPTVLPPDLSPDGRWHLFANTLRGIHHYGSDDGLAWAVLQRRLFPGMRAFLVRGERYALVCERVVAPWRSYVALRRSDDLFHWSDETLLVEPSLPWEGRFFRNCSCPCLARIDGGWRLYYSAGMVFLRDCGFPEPKYIGVAESERIEGPYIKRPEPIIAPSAADPWRNLGAGSLKVYREGDRWIGYNNGIYKDEHGTHSAIRLLTSPDGFGWTPAHDRPIVAPAPGWKHSHVYAMDVVERGDERWLYYNARDGWAVGSERIGLAIGKL